MLLSIITVTHKSNLDLIKYSHSFFKYHNDLSLENKNEIEIIFVENSGNNLDKFKKIFDDNGFSLKVIYCENNGFGSACNLGSKYALGDKIIFINPDIEFKSKILPNKKIKKLMFGTCLQRGKSPIPYSFELLPENKNIFCEISIIIKIINWIIITLNWKSMRFFPVGAFIVIDKKLFEDVGKFNEEFFLYYEEAELSKRIYKKFMIYPELIKEISIFHKSFGSHFSIDNSRKNESVGFITYCQIAGNKKILQKQINRLKILKIFTKGARIKYSNLIESLKKNSNYRLI